MKKTKIFGIFLIGLFVFSLLFSVTSSAAEDVKVYSALDKLPAILSDVFGLDLSKYAITNPRSGTHYEYGGFVEVENCAFELVDIKGDALQASGIFFNGFPYSADISVVDGSFFYLVEPPKGSVEELQNVFERYTTFAQKYGIATMGESLALDLFSKAPSSLPASALSPASVSLDNWTLRLSEKSLGFVYHFDGVEVPNKSLGITFENGRISFYDTLELYRVSELNVFSDKKEFEGFAFDLAQKFCDSFFSEDVKVGWSQTQPDLSLNLISGQMYNNPINNDLLEKGVGTRYSKDRDGLTLYPMWQAVFYFSQPVGNIVGVQVGVWGDTGEVAYCYEYGQLGGSSQYPSEDLSPSASATSQENTLSLPLIAVVSIVLVSVAVVAVFVKKNHK